ncbi:hypothetical protein GHO25_25945, partial [Pseudomonas sp. FSL R10-1350]|uniref:hypothetical protein n=1 Tax=Pseudomonas sp. FSL R10-1350 TaxID=2662197 RepID=UPI001296AF67
MNDRLYQELVNQQARYEQLLKKGARSTDETIVLLKESITQKEEMLRAYENTFRENEDKYNSLEHLYESLREDAIRLSEEKAKVEG